MKTPDVIVLGAGISGLTFANDAAEEGLQVLVLERAPSIGGCVRSERLPDGFWFELGAHTSYNSYGGLLHRLAARGRADAIVRRGKAPFRLVIEGAIRSIFSALSLFELLVHAPRVLWAKRAGATVAAYFGGLVGPRNWERVFSPLLSAVPSQRADEIPAELLFKKRPRVKRYPKSFTLQGGLQSFLDALAAHPGVTVRTGAPAREVRRAGDGVTVALEDGSELTARAVAIATPPDVAAGLVRQDFPALAAPLAKLGVAKIRSVGVVVERDAVAVPPAAGLVPTDGRFFSAVTRDVVPDEARRAFTFHCAASTSREEALALAASTLKVPTSAFVHVAESEVTLPSPRLGHEVIVRELDAALSSTPLYLVGNYFGGLALEDCVQRASAEATRLSAQSFARELREAEAKA